MVTWSFQAFPRDPYLKARLLPGQELEWPVTARVGELRAGELAYLWSAERAGIGSSRKGWGSGVYLHGWAVTLSAPRSSTAPGEPRRLQILFGRRFEPPVEAKRLVARVPSLESYPLFPGPGGALAIDNELAQQIREHLSQIEEVPDEPARWAAEKLFARLSPLSRRALGTADAMRCGTGQRRMHMEHLIHALYQKAPGPARAL